MPKAHYVTTVQPLWRDRQSLNFDRPDGIYLTETAPLMPPVCNALVERWELHSVQPLPLFGEPKLLCVWRLVMTRSPEDVVDDIRGGT